MAKPGIRECLYCKRFNRWGHYVPPSFGDEGFAACASFWKTDDDDPEVKRMNDKYNRPIPVAVTGATRPGGGR